MHSFNFVTFHTTDWAVLMEIKGVLPDLCRLKIALWAEVPASYWKIMEFQTEVTNLPTVHFLCAKANMPTF